MTRDQVFDGNDRRSHEDVFDLRFPPIDGARQDEEWCVVSHDGREQRLRFHDYGEIYDIPGLYEHLFYERLRCSSPQVVARLLARELERAGIQPSTLSLLDVGAGNGISGEHLAAIGIGTQVGIDLITSAATAAARDRPGLYADYFVADLTALDDDVAASLQRRRFNALTCVGALGFGDIPPAAFATAYDLLVPGGWLAITLKEDFLCEDSQSGFDRLIGALVDSGLIEPRATEHYAHRLLVSGAPVQYVAMVAVKRTGDSATAVNAGLRSAHGSPA